MKQSGGKGKLPDPAQVTSWAIIRLSSLGDVIHTLPAFAKLRRALPAARIAWIAQPAAARLLENFTGIDEIIPFDLSGQGVWRKFQYLRSFVRRQRGRFDLIVDFQGLLKSAVLAFLLGGRRVGFARGNLREPWAAVFYHHHAPPFPEERHVILKNLHLLSLFGLSATAIEYPLRPLAPSPRLLSFLAEAGLPEKKFAVLNVGGLWPTKVLSEEKLADLARSLRAKLPLVLLWGNEGERRLSERLAAKTGSRPAIFLDFSDLICFISRAGVVVSADTLVMHIADMLDVPLVGYFGPTAPERNGPLRPHSRVVRTELPCLFCYRRKCDTMLCMEQLSPQAIAEAAEEVYAQFP